MNTEGAEILVDMRHRPPEIMVKDNQYSGPIKEVIETLADKNNLTVKWQNVPWPRTLIRAKSGTVDIVPRHSLTEERRRFLLPMLLGFEKRQVYYLLAPKYSEVGRYLKFKNFSGMTFGLLRGSYYSDVIAAMPKNRNNVVYANNIEQLLSLLLLNRIDVLPTQNISWIKHAYQSVGEKYDLQFKIAPYKDEFLSGKYISVSKSSAFSSQYHNFNCDLFKMRKAGVIEKIYTNYGVTPYVQDFSHSLSKEQERSCSFIINGAYD